MAELTPRFSTNRMLFEYVDRLYAPAAQSYRRRTQDGVKEASLLVQWRDSLNGHWPRLRFGRLDVQKDGEDYVMTVAAYLDEIDAKAVQVQLYAEAEENGKPEIYIMEAAEALAGSQNGWMYRARVPARRPAKYYTPRMVPYMDGAAVPLEAAQILWYES
jgi:starch phosphorylase